MARKYQTIAQQVARTYECARCDRDLQNARYDGECCFGYDKQGREKWIAVYLVCRCGGINDVSLNMQDETNFMDTVDEVGLVPHRAKKITTTPVMAEETVT